ncbi:unnamed protein product [Mytilus coruscus]|uniref:Uncharacterized protein n=1 Tax=Mytilus coruscus TaxID=42192 RepID=A0A6J8ATA8_MYTCO|nr:unnamed protein product [Mytilus coruscus]
MDSYIFSSPRTGYLPLATNLWTESFKMFELHTIMRQAENKSFAELLNRVREGKQTTEDIDVLKGQGIAVDSEDYPWDAPHLFTTNERVDSYNCTIIHINRSPNPVYSIKAIRISLLGLHHLRSMKTKILETFKNSKNQTKQLSTILEVSVGVHYEITVNLDTPDGLINGASCKMVKVELTDAPFFASGKLWVQFNDPEIGKQLRKDSRRFYKSCHKKEWTPLEPIGKTFCAGTKGQAQIQRYQFPLRAAHAKTIHRCSGDTMQRAVVDLTTQRKVDHIHYVAISRVQTLNGLHITNLQEDKIGIDKSVRKEMERLRENPVQPSLQFLYKIEQSDMKLCFLNASSMSRHIDDIRSDNSVLATNIACFSETRFHKKDSFNETSLPGFQQYRQDENSSDVTNNTNRLPFQNNKQKENSSGKATRPVHGLHVAVYSKEDFVKEYPLKKTYKTIEVAVVKTELLPNVVILVVYKPPKTDVKDLCHVLLSLHHQYVKIQRQLFLGISMLTGKNNLPKKKNREIKWLVD